MALQKNEKLVGRVGSKSYAIVAGRQIVRQLPTSVTQTRTEALMTQRSKWPNVIANYRALKGLLRLCFEYKAKGVSDYNRFVSVNLMGPNVYIDKSTSNLKGGVAAPYMISQGTLEPIVVTGSGAEAVTNIELGSLTISTTTKVKDFAKAVVENNAAWQYGDQISFIMVVQDTDVTNNIPVLRAYGYRVNLSETDETKLQEIGGIYGFATKSGKLAVGSNIVTGAFAWIHSRKSTGGKTLVSSQRLIDNNPILPDYCDDAAKLTSMRSYGFGSSIFIQPDGTSSGSSVVNGGSTGGSGSAGGSGSTGGDGSAEDNPLG